MIHLGQPGDAAQRVLEQRFVVRPGLQMLSDMADAGRLLDENFACICERLAENQAEERRFSEPLGPTMPTRSPLFTRKLTLLKTSCVP